MKSAVFVSGVPCTGKTWLGDWLSQERGFHHVDAEKNGGADLDAVGIHREWDLAINTGRAEDLTKKIATLSKPVVLNWGFPMCYLYFVRALQVAGIETWWIRADPTLAREAFVKRGKIDVKCFDNQMSDIIRHLLLIEFLFDDHIIGGLNADGSQRHPEVIWNEMTKGMK
ncbi:MAG: hypothetical protein HZA88_19360 [Verrucomicrobia bacterium]|nr:hypothetical protein [Verrucomicrobiota bacterium]